MCHNLLAESVEIEKDLDRKLSELYKAWKSYQEFFLTDEEVKQIPAEKRIKQFITDIQNRLPELLKENPNERPKKLPTVTLPDGKTYFVDKRLNQLRDVKNPHDYIDF